jgi:hypothetical protein
LSGINSRLRFPQTFWRVFASITLRANVAPQCLGLALRPELQRIIGKMTEITVERISAQQKRWQVMDRQQSHAFPTRWHSIMRAASEPDILADFERLLSASHAPDKS